MSEIAQDSRADSTANSTQSISGKLAFEYLIDFGFCSLY